MFHTFQDLDVSDPDFLHLDISGPNAKEFPYILHVYILDPARSNLDVSHPYITQTEWTMLIV